MMDGIIAPFFTNLKGKKITQKRIESGMKKALGASEICNFLLTLYTNRLSTTFYHWKSIIYQEKIVEEIEHESMRPTSHRKFYADSTLIKATRNIFKVYSK